MKNNQAVPRGADEWEVRDALETLLRAEKIKADKPLMKKVKALAAERAEHIRRLSATTSSK